MKKIIVGLFIITVGILIFNKSEDGIVIPNSAIRFRVIANSDSLEDQTQKMVIKENIEKEVYELINGAENTSDVRSIIKSNINEIEDIVKNYNVDYDINYGYNYFPSKFYKGVVYGEGEYESLVITLGQGAGKNFWCVLFPPLCLLETNSENISDVDYQFYVKNLIDKF